MAEEKKSSLSQHPEYELENEHLQALRAIIRRKIALENPFEIDPSQFWEVYGGADEITARIFHHRAIGQWDEWNRVVDSPYFGRFDFHEDRRYPETWYIGYEGFTLDGKQVIDWRAPIAQLFYRSGGGLTVKQSYLAPKGTVWGQLLLKRHLRIAKGTLNDIVDEVDQRPERVGVSQAISAEDLLIRELYTRGDPRLQDIVKTIQEHQDRIIRAPWDITLVINGVAGSGKTSIGYHRVAYLLYPETRADIRAGRTIIFGPNRLFMSYVRELLPSLGVHDVAQVSFDDWAMERAGLVDRVPNRETRTIETVRRYTLQEAALAAFLSPKAGRASRQDHWDRARLKGSEKFLRLLERYVQARSQAFTPPKQGLMFTGLGPEQLSLGLDEWEIRSIVNKAAAQSAAAQSAAATINLPYETLRQRAIAGLVEALNAAGRYDEAVNQEYRRLLSQAIALRDRLEAAMRELGGRQPVGREVEAARKVEREIAARQRAADEFRARAYGLPNVRREAQEQAAAQLRVEVDKLWPAINLRDDYYRLLGDAKMQAETGKGLLSGEEIRLLGTMQPAPGEIDIEDIPALLWLHILVHGKGEISYDHIVVDEGQDFSPLQYRLLRLFSKNGSMTILGDISQGIYAHRGLTDWKEVSAALGEDDARGADGIRFETIEQNYRSTTEIVEFTNAVLKRRSAKAVLARPFNRVGEPPCIVEAPNRGAMYQALDEDIRALLDKGLQNIGVIGKTVADCRTAAQALGEAEYGVSQITSRDTPFRYQGGVVLLPVDLAKGIEFQAALVIDADEVHYDQRVDYDGRLLYVALTRALHVLNVYAVGKASGWLEGAREAIS